MKAFRNIMWVLVAFVFFGCNQTPEFVELESGFSYRILEDQGGDKLENGDMMIMDMDHYLGDSVIFESNRESGYFLNPNTGAPPQLRDVLVLCKEGDSAQIQMSLGKYASLMRLPLSPDMDTSALVTWNIRVNEIENESTILERLKNERLAEDRELIEDYLVNNNLEAQSTDDGLYYIISQQGNGEFPEVGNTVYVKYVLRLTDGTLIDTSYEELAKENDLYNPQRTYGPLSFELGSRGIIPGWNMGIPKFSKGGKGTILVPSVHGYGARSNGAIPPNSVLIFDIEVTDFK